MWREWFAVRARTPRADDDQSFRVRIPGDGTKDTSKTEDEMSLYTIALFIHVCGAVGYFISAGTRVLLLAGLRRARQVEQVRLISQIDGRLGPVFGISVLLVLIAGLYMAATGWTSTAAWIGVALVSLVVMAPLGAITQTTRQRAIERMARETPDGPIPAALAQRIHDPVLRTSVQTVLILLLGIVFLMTVKPALLASIIVMVVALALGLATALLPSRPAHSATVASGHTA